MNEPMPALPPASDTTVRYRSLSAPAVIGLIVSALFAAWLAVTAADALRTGKPLLIQPGWLLVPLGGAVISGWGWLQIHRSEGSRAGVRPAQWGVLLGTLSALSYGAWYVMTALALGLQAREFTDAWFDNLRQSKADDRAGHVAFWCSLPPLQRDSSFGELASSVEREKLLADPARFQAFEGSLRGRYLSGERRRKGPLPLFFEHEVVQLVRQAGAEAEIESLGVRDWEHVEGSAPGYKVEQAYRVQTPDGVFELTVPVLSLDKDRRRWWILLAEAAITQREYTPRGRLVEQLRLDSYRFADNWVKKFNEGNVAEVSLLPAPSQRMVMDNPQRLQEVSQELTRLLHQPPKDRNVTLRLGQFRPDFPSPYEQTSMPAELIVYHSFEGNVGAQHRCEGMIVVATSDSKLVALEGDGTGLSRQSSRWRVVGLRLLRRGATGR
jgi:hypothetical protein